MWLFKGQIRNMKNLSKIPETGKHAKGLGTLDTWFLKNSFPGWSALLFHMKHLVGMNVCFISSSTSLGKSLSSQ